MLKTIMAASDKRRANRLEFGILIYAKFGSYLTRIRWQFVIYFWFYRGSLPENAAGRQPRFRGKTQARQNPYLYMSAKTTQERFGVIVLLVEKNAPPPHGGNHKQDDAAKPQFNEV